MVGATLEWSPFPRTAPPSAGHCLGTTGPGGWSGVVLGADWERRPGRRLERRLSSRRLGSASFRAPGMATSSGDSAGERCDSAGHPQGVPRGYRGLGVSKKFPTLAKNTGRLETAYPVGDWKSPLLAKNTGAWKDAPPSRRVKHAAPRGFSQSATSGSLLVWRGVILGALFRALGVLEARRLDVLAFCFGEKVGPFALFRAVRGGRAEGGRDDAAARFFLNARS